MENKGIGFWDLMFGAGPALQTIYQLGFRPKEEDLYELTGEQYDKYLEDTGDTSGERVYMLLPHDAKKYADTASGNEVMVLTESDKATMERAWQIVESYCKESGREFHSDEEMLQYAATRLPEAFTQGTRFEVNHKSRMFVTKAEEGGPAGRGSHL